MLILREPARAVGGASSATFPGAPHVAARHSRRVPESRQSMAGSRSPMVQGDGKRTFGSGSGVLHRGLLALVLLLLVGSRADAASLARQCRAACKDEIAACVSAGGAKRACRRDVLTSCKQD